MNPMTYVIVNLAIAALVWTGGTQVNTGIITQGEVVALINLSLIHIYPVHILKYRRHLSV